MKKLILPVQFIFLFSQFMFSQLESFDLSKYKLPEIKRKQLDFNFDFSESSDNTKSKDKFAKSSQNKRELNGVANLRYVSFVNTANYQGNQNFYISFSPESSKDKLNEDWTKEYALRTNVSINSENRFYFPNLYFFEADVISYEYFNSGKTKDDDESQLTKYNSYNINVEVPLKVGKGRIEPIQDARLAVYIFEDLQKQGRLSRNPSEEEITEFSQLISKLKNERYFDYRLKRIAEIEKVDSFLQVKGFVHQADAKFFTSIYDNWEYSQGPFRQSGTRFAVGLSPIFAISRNYSRIENNDIPSVTKTQTRYKKQQVNVLAEFIKETPLNLYWQRSVGIIAQYQLQESKRHNVVNETENNYNVKHIYSRAYYGLGYYPNSRTSFNTILSINTNYSRYDYEDDAVDKQKYFSLWPGLSFNMSYYISPQLRMNANFITDYRFSEAKIYPETDYIYSNSKTFNQEFSVSFIYSIY